MPNKYRRTIGKRRYRDFSRGELERAKNAVRGGLSIRAAAEQYGIPHATLQRKLKNLHMKNPGGPCALSQEEETAFSEAIITAANWGFPFEKSDIQLLVKNYLDRSGRQLPQFNENAPGNSWYYRFLERHGQLTQRLAENIKRARAEISPDVIEEYFNNLETTLANVPPENCVNYDETNFLDDPGRSKVVVRRGVRHAERVVDSSKSATSVMFSCSGSGSLLPPYIVYKSEHLWHTWLEGGPEKAVYNRSKSGWFDQHLFEDWFVKIALPYFKNLDGPKVLIGDNLASHISITVIRACTNNDIRFVLLPPNSTHLTQPLDVSCFGPLKKKWREVLKKWKMQNRGPIRKDRFPTLLRSTLDKIEVKMEENIRAGFRATGLIPLDRNEVLKRLPKQDRPLNENVLNDSVKAMFKETRFGKTDEVKRGRKKKVNVPAGQSVTGDKFLDSAAAGPSSVRKSKSNYDSRKRARVISPSPSEESYIDDDQELEDTSQTEPLTKSIVSDMKRQIREVIPSEESDNDPDEPENENDEINDDKDEFDNLQAGDFIIAELTSSKGSKKRFIGKVVSGWPNAVCAFLKKHSKCHNTFIYPDIPDESVLDRQEFVIKLPFPTFNRRGGVIFDDKIISKLL